MNRIKDLRKAMGWTQSQLGKKINASKSTVSEYESETHQLDPALICTLCDIFGCTADYLLGRSDVRRTSVTTEQDAILRAYDSLPIEIRKAVDGLLAPYMIPEKKKETA
jgi:transcriptional regulator with XRE-family HTH domain